MFKSRMFFCVALLVIGVLSLLITTSGMVIADAFSTVEKPVPAPAEFPRIADTLRAELNTALSPDFPINFDTAGNPFADRSGISNLANERPATASLNQGPPIKGGAVLLPGSYPGPGVQMPSGVPLGAVAPGTLPVPESRGGGDNGLNERLQERNRMQRQGLKEIPDVASLYDIEDVRPVGIVGSGDRNRVIFYSPVTKQTFSVARGTKFRNGTLEGLDDEGVKFKSTSGNGTSNRWMKNSERKSDTPDSPLVRVP